MSLTHQAIDVIADAVLSRVAQKAAGSAVTGVFGHGPQGIYSLPGLERRIFSAMMLPVGGLQAELIRSGRVSSSRYNNPLLGILTGQTANSGNDPDGPCDAPKNVGAQKLCTRSLPFGLQRIQTDTYNVNRFGLLRDRSELMDFEIIGNPNNAALPQGPGFPDATAYASNDIAKAYQELAVGYAYETAREVYTGNPTNDTVNGGRLFFNGLDVQINTGYVDARTGVACPAADSDVRNFGGQDVRANGQEIVGLLIDMVRNLRYQARLSGFGSVEHRFVMLEQVFHALVDVWPCTYAVAQCSPPSGANTEQHIDVFQAEQMRNRMRGDLQTLAGQHLLIDGMEIPVILDEAITETVAGGIHESTIYLVPWTINTGIPAIRMEYFDMRAPGGPVDASRAFAPADSFVPIEEGRFLINKKPPTELCVQMGLTSMPRLVLETPQLAGRLDDVGYTIGKAYRSWEPGNTYFYNGGQTTYPDVPSYYDPTA